MSLSAPPAPVVRTDWTLVVVLALACSLIAAVVMTIGSAVIWLFLQQPVLLIFPGLAAVGGVLIGLLSKPIS